MLYSDVERVILHKKMFGERTNERERGQHRHPGCQQQHCRGSLLSVHGGGASALNVLFDRSQPQVHKSTDQLILFVKREESKATSKR